MAVALLLVIISGVLVRENFRLRSRNERLNAQLSAEAGNSAHAMAVLEVLELTEHTEDGSGGGETKSRNRK